MLGCTGAFNETYSDNAKIAQPEDNRVSTGADADNIGGENGNEYSYSCSLSGTRTVWHYDAQKDSDIELNYLLSVTKGGKAKLVLITPDNEVITLVENTDNTVNTEMQSQTVSIKKGNNRIKIVGSNAPKLELKLRIEVGQWGAGEWDTENDDD